jgi:hypothetical protein
LGGKIWDDDFCPACTKQIAQTAITGGLAIVLGKSLGGKPGPSGPPWPRRL